MPVLQDAMLMRLGKKLVNPFYEEYVQPASIDLHLGDRLMIMNSTKGTIIPTDDSSLYFDSIYLDKVYTYLLPPNEFIIGSTHETITMPDNLVARFEGKSSLGRLGLMTHVTAGFIDPGFSGRITVEIKNLTNRCWVLIPGMKIGQICFETLEGPAKTPYGSNKLGSRYQGDNGPALSRIHYNFKIHPDFEREEQDDEA